MAAHALLLLICCVIVLCRRNAQGRGAETVYRDKETGQALTREEYVQKQKEKVGCGRRAD